MNFSELLQNMFNAENKYFDRSSFGTEYIIKSEVLKTFYKDRLLETDAFSDVKSLSFLDAPSFTKENGENILTENFIVTDGIKYRGDAYIYSISLTGQMFDSESLTTPIKDNALISHAIYDPTTFTPKKIISLFFSPEVMQDLQMKVDYKTLEDELRASMHETLDKVFDNPKEYQVMPFYYVMVRGYFTEQIEWKNNSPRVKIKISDEISLTNNIK
jgi:hypothetical protein